MESKTYERSSELKFKQKRFVHSTQIKHSALYGELLSTALRLVCNGMG